ncbi:MAG: hypothetical protein WD055_01220 [Candidatus Dependentiae bacterium]
MMTFLFFTILSFLYCTHISASDRTVATKNEAIEIELDDFATSLPVDVADDTQEFLVGTSEYAQVYTQALYGKICGNKFCTDILRERLEHLKEQDKPKFNSLIGQLNKKNEIIKKKSNPVTRKIDPNVLTQIVTPEMITELLKAVEAKHNEQNQTITTHETTIGQKESELETARLNYKIAIVTTLGSLITAGGAIAAAIIMGT